MMMMMMEEEKKNKEEEAAALFVRNGGYFPPDLVVFTADTAMSAVELVCQPDIELVSQV